MSDIVRFELETGEVVFIESTGDGGRTRPARRGEVFEKASETFEHALETVKPAAQAIVKAFKEFNEPAEIGLDFGIEFSSEVQAFVVKGEGKATFKLSLKWKNSGS